MCVCVCTCASVVQEHQLLLHAHCCPCNNSSVCPGKKRTPCYLHSRATPSRRVSVHRGSTLSDARTAVEFHRHTQGARCSAGDRRSPRSAELLAGRADNRNCREYWVCKGARVMRSRANHRARPSSSLCTFAQSNYERLNLWKCGSFCSRITNDTSL